MSPQLPETIIDFHVHLFPDALFDAIWSYFSKGYGWQVIYKYYHRQCIEYLRSQGVTKIVYSNYAHKKGVASSLNQWNMGVLNKNPDLYCFGAFHPDDDDCLSQAEAALSHPRFIGFKLQLLVQDFYATDERLFPLYEMVQERHKRILFHAGNGPTANDFVGFKQFEPLMHRYPDLPANIAHLGGYEFEPFFGLLQAYPNLMMDTAFCFFKEMDMVFDLPLSFLENNRDRLLYGSDFPNLTLPRENEIDMLLSLNLSDEFYQNLFQTNAERILNELCSPEQIRDRLTSTGNR